MENETTQGRAQDSATDSVQADERQVGTSETYKDGDKEQHSYDWTRRVLSENKKYKSKLNDVEERLKAYEERELEQQGKYQDLVKALREENSKLKSAVDERDSVYSWSKRSEALRHTAEKEGCVRAEHLLRLMSDEQLQAIEIDDDYNPVQEDVVRVINEFKANPEYDYLFKKKAPSVDTVTPNSKFVKDVPKTLKDLSMKERVALLGFGASKE